MNNILNKYQGNKINIINIEIKSNSNKKEKRKKLLKFNNNIHNYTLLSLINKK